jgi:hypothetical protein
MPEDTHAPLLPLVGTRFQDLFHRPPGLLFTFPSRYWCTIGHGFVFSLGGWSPQIQTGFLVSRPTQVPVPLMPTPCFAYGALTLSRGAFQLASTTQVHARGKTPARALQPREP